MAAQRLEGLRTDAGWPLVVRRQRQLDDLLDAVFVQAGRLRPAHVGDEAQVVVGFALCVAVPLPVAQLAVLDGVGVGAVRARSEGALEPALDAAVVSGEVTETEALAGMRAEDDVDLIRLRALLGCEQLGVEAELEQEVRLDPPCELGVSHLVAPLAERRWLGHALEEVGVAAPAIAIEKDRLVDDLGSAPHRLARALGAALQPVEARLALDLNDLAPGGAQRLHVSGLVLVSLAGDQLSGLFACLLDGRASAHHFEVEMAQMRALEVVDEIGG